MSALTYCDDPGLKVHTEVASTRETGLGRASARRLRSFQLSKWYLDVVTDTGEAFLAHCGTLRLAGLSLSHASALFVPRDGPPRRRSTALACAAPQLNRGVVHWTSRRVGVEGRWRCTAAPISRRLFENPRGRIHWSCFAPLAQARVRLSNGAVIEGCGYVERLEMTIFPWMLPLEELLWGRFHSGDSYLLWIAWRGARPLTLVIRDGIEERGAIVGEECVWLADRSQLSLVAERALREGPAVPPALAAVLPGRLGSWHEAKRLSRGELTSSTGAVRRGWAIHERVAFGD